MPRNRRFVLLDRDGTINVEREYLADPAQVELLPGAARGLRAWRELGFGLIVVTNQSGIGRGYFDTDRLNAVHDRLLQLLLQEDVTLDAIYVCPHAPENGCDCRKPRPGLVERAARDFKFLPSECVVIGDKASDIELGRAIGATTVLVRTGYGAEMERLATVRPHHIADNLGDAAVWFATRNHRRPVSA